MNKQNERHGWRRLSLLSTLLLTLTGIGGLLGAPVASAGTEVIYDCPSAGSASPGPWQVFGAVSASKTSCSDGAGDFIAGLGGEMPAGSQTGVSVSVPGGSGMSLAAVSVYWYSPQSTSGAHTYALVSANGTLLGQSFGPADHRYIADNYTLPAEATNFVMETYCSTDDGPAGCQIASGNQAPDIEMLGSQITVKDPTPPTGSVTPGPLTGTTALSGTQSLSYQAQDANVGIRAVQLHIDGQLAAENNYASQCSYTNFLACPESKTDALGWNTASVVNGRHWLEVIAVDAAGNDTVLYAGTVTSENASQPSPQGAPPGPGSNSTSASNTNTSTAGVGAPNGTPASEVAQLQLGIRQTIRRAYAHRALAVPGRLLAADGQPIANASLDILQQVAGAPAPQLITRVVTGPDGAFIARVPAGVSRLIQISYRAFSNDPSYAAIARIDETVDAGVRLRITTILPGPEGLIELSGRVAGPIPPQGAIVDLLVHYRGRWEPFRTPRTDRQGRFYVLYQFQGAVGRFPFRAEVPSGQAGFPYGAGESQVVDVKTN